MASGVDTMARWLAEHGYDTAGIVSSILLGPRRGFQDGFGSFEVVLRRPRETAAPEIHERALAWLDPPRDRPFFLFLHYYDVHSDYAPEERYRDEFVGPYEGAATGSTEQLKAARLGQLTLAPADAKHLSDLYDAEIRQLDDELRGFFGVLEQRGLLDDTAIVVTSDHGEEFLEHGGILHGRTLYGELVRVPLLFAGPGVPAGQRVAGPVSLIDVFPTAMGLLGVAPPPYVEGIDLAAGGWQSPRSDRPVFLGTDWWLGRSNEEWRRAVQQGDWKLHYAHPGGALELYDVANDPGERRNLAASAPERSEALRTLLAPHLRAGGGDAATTQPTKEETEQLRALGYVE
jgi:arylsulfatase A-like enzyme